MAFYDNFFSSVFKDSLKVVDFPSNQLNLFGKNKVVRIEALFEVFNKIFSNLMKK